MDSRATYEKLNSAENASIENNQSRSQSWPYSKRPSVATCFFAFTTVLFSAQSLYLWAKYRQALAPTCTNAFDAGYPTEWGELQHDPRCEFILQSLSSGPVVESIELEQTTFTSPLRYNASSKQLYRDFDPTQPQYIGQPSPDVDAAWDSLLGGQFLLLSDDEAAGLDDPVLVDGRWVGETEKHTDTVQGRGNALPPLPKHAAQGALTRVLRPRAFGASRYVKDAPTWEIVLTLVARRALLRTGPAKSPVRG
ncbi:uncharacterized protein DSM5745_00795 [Aspergillus mulundensis]|uniref:Uncharacterized protein n=1 Tax=Aspergillus mulundensis TaxID=1810919 RepID=A0A3D8T4I9_9EURO|nr:hypothetical protein DSM5745_00795 [Aspergillus mulundensis]RDW93473.1 hypothetical protein DSM5745_00795 [Aspergillus mulundensis]